MSWPVPLLFALRYYCDLEITALSAEGKGDPAWHALLLKIAYREFLIVLN